LEESVPNKQEFRVKVCKHADADHAKKKRQYAHTFCAGNRSRVICVAGAFFDLPIGHQAGILAHEVGHILAGWNGGEADADAHAEILLGVTITYRDGPHGKNLQWLDEADRNALDAQVQFFVS
jgi:hypothetical protein